jgi:hypothetical protein
MNHLLTLVWCAAIVSSAHAQVPARQGARASSTAQIVRMMQETVDMQEFQQPMTLKEALGLFYEKFLNKGKELPILIDQRSFKVAEPDAPDIYETQVKFPPYPKQMPFVTAFKIALSQVPFEATFLVRAGRIDIIAAKEVALDKLARQPVVGDYSREPVLSVISDLADQTGLSIVMDNRIEDKLNVPVTVTFSNGINAQDALRALCDMAGLKLVELPTSYYVTSRASATADELHKSVKRCP